MNKTKIWSFKQKKEHEDLGQRRQHMHMAYILGDYFKSHKIP